MAGREVVGWHHAINQVSGAIALRGYTAELTADELEQWSETLAGVAKEMKLSAKRMRPIKRGRK